MGINDLPLQYLFDNIKKLISEKGINIIEFGNSVLKKSTRNYIKKKFDLPKELYSHTYRRYNNKGKLITVCDNFLEDGGKYEAYVCTAKKFFTTIGHNYTCIDYNGLDDSLVYDLSKKIDDEFLLNKFDVLIDFGTGEHIGQRSKVQLGGSKVENVNMLDSPQYYLFLNSHNVVKVGGFIYHVLPYTKNWIGHGAYDYNEQFFTELAEANDYKIVFIKRYRYEKGSERLKERPLDVISVLFQKTKDQFMTQQQFNDLNGLRKTGY